MANLIKWGTPGSTVTPISGVTVNAGAGSLGTEYDNETNKNRLASFELTFAHTVAPTANRVWLLYLIVAQDGTNYETGSGSVQPAKKHVVAFPALAVTTSQPVTIHNVMLPPFKFKPLVWNDTDQNSTASSVTLDMRPYNEEAQ